jgi:Flp pilus assembly protein TadB
MTVDPYEAERRRSLEEYESRDRKSKVFRVSDTERERAVRQLRQHLADGRIDMEEFTERLDLVYQAKTNLDIDRALHQLPFVSVDPAVINSTSLPERRQIAPFAPLGAGGGKALARHTAAFALAACAVFAVTALLALLTGGGALAFVLLLPMAAWAILLFVQAMRELGHGDGG